MAFYTAAACYCHLATNKAAVWQCRPRPKQYCCFCGCCYCCDCCFFGCCCQVVHEPVDQWQCVPTVEGGTLNLLDRFYSDPERYAYTFQNYVFMSRVLQVRLAVREH